MYHVGIARTESEIEVLIRNWKSSFATTSCIWPHHNVDWNESLRKLLDPNRNFFYLYIERNGSLTHIFPMMESEVVKKGMRFKAISLACHSHSPYSDIISNQPDIPEKEFKAALNSVAKGFSLFAAKSTPANSTLLNSLSNDLLYEHTRQVATCDYIDLLSRNSSEDGVSKNFRNNLRKSAKKFAKLEGIEIETSSQHDDLPRLLKEFLQVEGSGWKAKQGSAIKQNPDLIAFYERLIDNASTHIKCEISIIRQKDQPISGQFSVICGPTQYLLKIGYEESFEKLAPGRYHMKILLDRLIEQKTVSTLNLMSDAKWHESWNPEKLSLSNTLISCRSWKGKSLIFALKQQARIKMSTQRP